MQPIDDPMWIRCLELAEEMLRLMTAEEQFAEAKRLKTTLDDLGYHLAMELSRDWGYRYEN